MVPPAVMAGLAVGGALMGGKAGRQQAKTMSQPTYSYVTPPDWLGGQGTLQGALNRLNSAYNPENFPDLGPTNQQSWLNNLITARGVQGFDYPDLNSLMGMRGHGVGGFTPHLFGVGGGGGWESFVDRMSPYAKGVGNWRGFLNQIKGIEADPTQYESDVLAGKYLDTQNTPEVIRMQEAIGRELNEDRTRALSQAMSPFMADPGTMGMSGANAAMRRGVVDDYSESLANALAAANYNLYGAERQRMNEVDAILSGRTQSLWGNAASAFGASTAAKAQLQSALMGAAASAYGSDNALAAALESALIGADARGYAAQAAAHASMYGSDRALQGAWLGHLGQNQALNWNALMGAYDVASRHGQQQDANALFNMDAASQYWNMINSGLAQWGTQYNQGPRYSPSAGAKQGALGGAMSGASLAGMFGGGGAGAAGIGLGVDPSSFMGYPGGLGSPGVGVNPMSWMGYGGGVPPYWSGGYPKF